MMELRSEYKKHCKVQGRGINIAKHLKLKTSGNFGKVAYVTALGKYESEGHWANFWYQAHGSRRELVIEALTGRSNAEMRAIVDAFRDKRYGDSLARCMDKELKPDKFREAVLLALQGKRQEETEVYPLEYRNRDVDALYRALKSTDGGERAIIEIVVRRSDAHLREVLKTYERKHQGNFAREALRKSGNLVGELIAHVLNGVINKPARDALLLHHAIANIASSKSASHPSSHSSSSSSSPPSSRHPARSHPSSAEKDGLRYELLVSRLVRLHWDRAHLSRVKQHYRDRYAASLDDDLAAATKGDFGEFCLALCDVGR
ncbi:hypothetical protein B0A49_12490 [Cryomyces minteri]|uniref:Annexin n=1 Tax=Cryomyces minteri TaxID=331657 RepID=A0A4U0VKC9_9PEZI|nr:hypothetical protein B0A49_12490 [Cryomyces minteri]